MNVRGKKLMAPLTTAFVLAFLSVGCIPADQTSSTSSGDPISTLIGFAIDFGRQILAAFLF
ncbi:MAG: hypothetical protein HBSAPP02_31110 [Phycisphaerae bacterium]|nr:MAG: hypothetical protein HBSAPP02_31110 [Phycisphaerae bacterium]